MCFKLFIPCTVTIIILNRKTVHTLLFTQNKDQYKNKVIGLMLCNKVLNLRSYKKFKKVLFEIYKKIKNITERHCSNSFLFKKSKSSANSGSSLIRFELISCPS